MWLPSVSLRAHPWRVLGLVVALAAVLAVGLIRPQQQQPQTHLPLDDWDIPRLVDYLNEKGLGLRVVSTQKNGRIGQTAFLTTTEKEWIDLNPLPRVPKYIDRWQGTLYCERGVSEPNWSKLTSQWGDCWLAVGPFLLYGDRELLARVRAAVKTR